MSQACRLDYEKALASVSAAASPRVTRLASISLVS
jgi:hypothetical protein